jgi:bacillithiol biosynthesis cysteine-adding enzyme BshC
MRDLFAEYVAERPELMAFYAGSVRALNNAAPKTGQWHSELVEALGEYQCSLGGRHLFMGDEAVVVTGQQPGLFTGPMYTIYKAATAVLLSKKVHDRFGVRCVPVFWVGSDDHDFEEARTAHVLDKNHELLSLTYSPEASVEGLPLYKVPLEPSLHTLIDAAASNTTGSEVRDDVAKFLHESLDASESFADWTARILVRLFKDTPLVVFSPHLPVARRLFTDVMEHEVRDPLVSTFLLNRTGQRLRDLDYHQQVVKGDNECNFFLDVDGRRRKVIFDDDKYSLPEVGATFTVDEMLQMLHGSPERFSPNVALRCVMQQTLFPAAAYVAGPSEIAYWAQLKPLFRHFDQDMPIVYPRARCLLKSIKVSKLMEKFGFSREDLAVPQEELVERALETTNRGPAKELVARHRPEIEAALQPLKEALEPVNPNAAGMVNAMGRRIAEEFDRIEAAILKGDEEQTESIRKQVARIVTTLYPAKKPQERVLNVLSFLFEYGWSLIPRILKEIDVDSFEQKEIEL